MSQLMKIRCISCKKPMLGDIHRRKCDDCKGKTKSYDREYLIAYRREWSKRNRQKIREKNRRNHLKRYIIKSQRPRCQICTTVMTTIYTTIRRKKIELGHYCKKCRSVNLK